MKQDLFELHYGQLKKMRFSGMADELKRQHEDVEIVKVSADERISRLIQAESDVRHISKIRRLVNAAAFRYPHASLDLETLKKQGANMETVGLLTECTWIKQSANLLITGPTGSGKSYFACALGCAAAMNGLSVRYEKTSSLLRILEAAEDRKELSEFLTRYSRYNLLILDDFGLMSLNPDMCRNLFELIDSREGRTATVLVSQYPVKTWYSLFGDNTYADACLDRLTKTSYRIELDGKSLRTLPKGGKSSD